MRSQFVIHITYIVSIDGGYNMALKIKMADLSLKAIAVTFALIGIALSLSNFGLFPSPLPLMNAIILMLLGAVAFIETAGEGKIHLTVPNVIVMILAIGAIAVGAINLTYKQIPSSIAGITGFLQLFVSVIVILELFM